MKKELNFIGLKNYLLDDVKIKKEVIQYYLKRIKNVIDYYKKKFGFKDRQTIFPEKLKKE